MKSSVLPMYVVTSISRHFSDTPSLQFISDYNIERVESGLFVKCWKCLDCALWMSLEHRFARFIISKMKKIAALTSHPVWWMLSQTVHSMCLARDWSIAQTQEKMLLLPYLGNISSLTVPFPCFWERFNAIFSLPTPPLHPPFFFLLISLTLQDNRNN